MKKILFVVESLSGGGAEKVLLKAVYYYASAMDKLQNHEKAMEYIKLLFDEEIATGIDNSFKNQDEILVNHYGLSPEDYVDNDDSFYMPFMKKFRTMQKNNTVDQNNNREIFK